METGSSVVCFHGDAANVHKGITPLAGEDIAGVIAWAVTRPVNVNIALVWLSPANQQPDS